MDEIKNVRAKLGHNSGEVVPGLVNLVDEIMSISDRKKALAKAERDCRNRAKTEFGVLAGVLAHEIRLRKMDKDVRVQFESNHQDVKTMLGYQAELDFVGGTPTKASLKQQPTEAELQSKQEPEPAAEEEFGGVGKPGPVPQRTKLKAVETVSENPPDNVTDKTPATTNELQREKPRSVVIGTGNVIRREG